DMSVLSLALFLENSLSMRSDRGGLIDAFLVSVHDERRPTSPTQKSSARSPVVLLRSVHIPSRPYRDRKLPCSAIIARLSRWYSSLPQWSYCFRGFDDVGFVSEVPISDCSVAHFKPAL